MGRRILLLICLVLASYKMYPQTIRLGNAGHTDVKGNIGHWRDATHKLTLEEIKSIQFDSLSPSKSPNFGFDRATHWFKLTITNESANQDWLMEIAYAPLDFIDFYMLTDSSLVGEHKTSGDRLAIKSRDVAHRHPIFSFNIPLEQRHYIYHRHQCEHIIKCDAIANRQKQE